MTHTKPSASSPVWGGGWLLIAALLVSCGTSGPEQPLFTVNGRVLDDKGQPLGGVVVTDDKWSAITDEAGRYSLAVFGTALTARKPGRATVHFQVADGLAPVTRMGPGPQTVNVAIDTRTSGSDVAGLRAAIATSATHLYDYPATDTGAVDVLVLITPGNLSQTEIGNLNDWVHGGGRLILCGEWGGYPSENLDVLNALAEPAGITFTGATVKALEATTGTENWNSVSAIAPQSLAKLAAGDGSGDQNVYLFSTTALGLTPPARAVLQSSSKAYSVLGLSSGHSGQQVLAAVGAYGEGKVFGLGDSSLWKDEDSDGAGVPNIQHGANARFVGALLRW